MHQRIEKSKAESFFCRLGFAQRPFRGFSQLDLTFMTLDDIAHLTHQQLPGVDPADLAYDVIEKGGSGRIFVRVKNQATSESWVAMSYTDDRPDNARFASITDFLADHGVAVPHILGRDEAAGFLLVQDLGSVDLGDFVDRDWSTEQGPHYQQSLDTVFALHQITEADQPTDLPELEFSFDAELYQWEQDYFFNHYVANFESEAAMQIREHDSLAQCRDYLSELPRSLVHRDFQSTNVMFQDDRCYLIDYQGMRFGLPEYDVASMVYDPYVHLSDDQRDSLIDYYYQLKVNAGHTETRETYQKVLDACALQRLMQALGAYGFLGLTKGKKEFLEHIEPAKQRLLSIAQRELPILAEVMG